MCIDFYMYESDLYQHSSYLHLSYVQLLWKCSYISTRELHCCDYTKICTSLCSTAISYMKIFMPCVACWIDAVVSELWTDGMYS